LWIVKTPLYQKNLSTTVKHLNTACKMEECFHTINTLNGCKLHNNRWKQCSSESMAHHSVIRHCMFYIPVEKHDFDSLSVSRELFPCAIWKNNKSASIRKNLLNLKPTWLFELDPEFHFKLGILTTLVMWPFPHFPNGRVWLSFVLYSIPLNVSTIWALNWI